MIDYPDPNSRSAALARRAADALPGGNTRDTIYFGPYPIYAQAGEGAYVTDVDGNRYLDLIGNYSALIHGHRPAFVVDAIRAQTDTLMAVGMPTESEVLLAELLKARVASLERVRFCNSGSEAVMFTIRAARAFTGRSRIAKIEGAYHGSYEGVEASMAPSPDHWGPAERPTTVGQSRGTPASVLSETVILPLNDVENATAILRETGSALAAVIVDPVMSRLGFSSPTPQFIDALRRTTRELGALLIADEVYALRVGYGGAQAQLGLSPDLTAMGKIIGGGLPVGAFGGRADIMALFSPAEGAPAVPHGGTFNANPLTMAAGLAAMRRLTPDEFSRLDRMGERLRGGLRALSTTRRPIQVSGTASLCAMTFSHHPAVDHRQRTAIMREHRAVMRLLHPEWLRRGLLASPAGQMIVNSAMTDADVDEALEVVASGLAAVSRELAFVE